jgi:hypothetical protein
MSGRTRVLGFCAGVAMIASGLLMWEGSRSGWVLGAGAALAFAGWLAAERRSE